MIPPKQAESVPEVVSTSPKRIYLNVYESDDSNRPFPKSCSDDEVTWSKEAALECAVPYVRADLSAQAEASTPVLTAGLHPQSLPALVTAAGGTALTGGGAALSSVALARFVVSVITLHHSSPPDTLALLRQALEALRGMVAITEPAGLSAAIIGDEKEFSDFMKTMQTDTDAAKATALSCIAALRASLGEG